MKSGHRQKIGKDIKYLFVHLYLYINNIVNMFSIA